MTQQEKQDIIEKYQALAEQMQELKDLIAEELYEDFGITEKHRFLQEYTSLEELEDGGYIEELLEEEEEVE